MIIIVIQIKNNIKYKNNIKNKIDIDLNIKLIYKSIKCLFVRLQMMFNFALILENN